MTSKRDPQLEEEHRGRKNSRDSDMRRGDVDLPVDFVRRPRDVLVLQRTYGNRTVRRLIENQPSHVQRSFLGAMLAANTVAGIEAQGRRAVKQFHATVVEPLAFYRSTTNPNEGIVSARVEVLAMFDPAGIDIEDLEYRQFIKGHVEMFDAGSGQTFDLDGQFSDLPDGKLHAGWQEDGDTSLGAGNAGYHYGHRDYKDHAGGDRDQYLPDRKKGDMYIGWDFPNIDHIPALQGDKGDTITWRMDFRGEIQYKGLTVMTKNWRIAGTITIPDATVNTVQATS